MEFVSLEEIIKFAVHREELAYQLYAESGPCRPAFRSDADRDSGGMPTGFPLASRPPFRCMPTGVLM